MNPIIIIDITGGTVHTVDSLLAAAVPTGASLVSSLNAQLGSTVWQTHPSGSDLVSALNTQLGGTVWQGGGSGTPAWGAIVGTLADQTDLQTALNGKAASSHTHTLSQISDITVTSDMVSIPKGIRPGLYDDLGTPPVGTIFEGSNDGHLYWCHRDGSVHLLCDSHGYGGGSWGAITGTLSDQTDLQDALDDKQDHSTVLDETVAFMEGTADQMIYSTGGGHVGSQTVPLFTRTFLGSSDGATARASLGLAIGSNVQAYDADLAAIAGLTSAADRAVYYTGAGTAALMTVTSTARGLLDDTSASAMRTTLGVVIGANVQAYSSRLTDLNTILVTPLASASQAAVTGTAGASYTSTEQQMINDLKTLVNQLRADLVTARIIKGSA